MPHPLFERHAATIDRALAAIGERGYWSPHSESPKAYGEGAMEAGKAAFDALLGKPFDLTQPGTVGTIGREVSPFGIPLGITYPKADLDALFAAIGAAEREWKKAGPEAWVGVSTEVLQRINKQSLLFAHAVMHTTGQAFMMAFQAGGPHAQDRALEAIAYAWAEMKKIPAKALWEKPQGKNEPLRMEKHFRIVPRGVGLVIGCNTFPTWNGFPGFFADLATGNAVVVKPHPSAILPLALMVKIAREVLSESGFDPNIVTLVAHDAADDVAQKLALRPEVRLIDFTGSAANGNWLEANAKQAQVYTEKSGVNQIVVDSADDFASVARNIAFSLSLYTGQMCTAPQNIYVPKGGIDTASGRLTFDQVASGIAEGVQKLLSDPARAVEILGAVVNDGVMQRLENARRLGDVVLDTQTLTHPAYPEARIRTPLIVKLGAADLDKYLAEWFGPILHVATWPAGKLSETIARVNAKGFGLTMGLHSRIARSGELAEAKARVGNLYINRSMIGAVVGSQPFGGEGLSGTGPKAGGPHYLFRFATERTVTINTAAAGGNASLIASSE